MSLQPLSGKWCLGCGQRYPQPYEGACVHSVQVADGPETLCRGPIVQILVRRTSVVPIRSRPDGRSQQGRVLAAMERNPARGITQVDFDLPNVCDRGAPIKRVAARIDELIDDGWPIEKAGTRDGCRIYRLRHLDAREAA